MKNLRASRLPRLAPPLALVLALAAFLALAGAPHASAQQGDSGRDLTLDILHSPASLTGPSLRGARLSPDGSLVTVLRGREGDADTLDLWAWDVATGEAAMLVSSGALTGADAELSEEEKNRRERQRIYASGIVSYQWDSAGEQILFPLGGDIFLYRLAEQEAVKVTETEAFETDPKISPAGGHVSFIRDDEVFVYDLATRRERRISSGASETVRNGVAEFVAQEELDRDTGYWWSPDDAHIAYTQIDESPVAIAERLDFGPDGTRTIRQRYPFAGTDNVTIRLAIAPVTGDGDGADTVWADLGENGDIYLADAVWARDGGTLYVTRLSRDQKRLDILAVDPETGDSETILTETSETWINLRGSLRPLSDGSFLRASERSGFNHLYHHGADGSLISRVTQGDWPVGGLSCVNEGQGEVYFTGWMDSPLENHVFSVPLEGGEPTRLTQQPGWHGASFGGDCSVWIHSFSAPDQPAQTALRDTGGARLFWLNQNALDADHPYAPYLASHVMPEFGTIEADDGTPLDYEMLKPDLAAGARAPAIVMVYGGPHVQRVSRGWPSLFEQFMVDQGYVVFRLDNRGAWNRGTAFENPLYRAMGQVEVKDQAAGARWLAAQEFVDPARIGAYGWSYGGYMVLMMLGQTPDLYAAGVSGAPVTDWRTYDTAYTERYMGDPREVADAYDASSVLTYADGIEDDALLLIHGMADDNVIFQNAIDLMAALQAEGTSFELMTYPGEKHGFRQRANQLHRDRLIVDFFDRKLKN